MAKATLLAGLGWVASHTVSSAIADASTYLGMDMARELQELETTVLPQFKLVIEAAEKNPHGDVLEKWLRKLKAAFYNAEDVLDGREYDILKQEVERGEQTSVLAGFHNAVASRVSNLLPKKRKRLSELSELKSILAEAKTFRNLLGLQAGNGSERSIAATIRPPTAPTSSHPMSTVFGRNKDRDRIIDLLTTPVAAEASEARYSVLSIVGQGGAGKTTLAQHVYHDERVEEHFDVKMWVCVSRKLDVSRHTREIVESASKEECARFDNLDTLQCKLKDILVKSQKFLLVLDDVWFDESVNEKEWDTLLAPLVSQQWGSKVLVTSRSTKLPAALLCEESFQLEDMEYAQFLELFKHHAFAGAAIRDPQLHENLVQIAEKIAKMLGRSPLAAKAVGSRLSKEKAITAWRTVLRNDKLRETRDTLLWSYQNLDPHLQRCFLYCSLFPKGYYFTSDQLIRLWVAEGLVDLCDRDRRIEDVGRNYFNEMVSCSFFQLVSHKSYNMHDLFHDLAEQLSKGDYFRLEDDNVREIPCTTRHLSISVESMIRHKQSICKLHNLRTVICIGQIRDDVSDIFHQILGNLKKLRALLMRCFNGNELPESVAELKHLRYLNLEGTSISSLPESLCTLYHLQFLRLNWGVKSLPDKLSNLGKLRRLEGYDKFLVGQIPNMGKLRLLQNMDRFCVRKEKGHEVRQLGDVKELSGDLTIGHLENVSGKDEALEAMLHKKNHLEFLKLVWYFNSRTEANATNLCLEVLEGLMPPPELKHLAFEGYESATYPTWLLGGSYFENLESFKLENCGALEGLPPNGQLFRNCNELCLHNVPNLKRLPCLPASLRRLEIAKCPLLMLISNEDHLTPQLASNLPSALCELDLSSCSITDGALAVCLEGLNCLEKLELDDITALTTLPPEQVLRRLTMLKDLSISTCRDLRSLGGLSAATSLLEFWINSCPSLQLAHDNGTACIPSSLKFLYIYECTLGADFLCNGLPLLRNLTLHKCRSSASLSTGHLTSLESLTLQDLPDLSLIEVLSSLHLHDVRLIGVPKLAVESIPQQHAWKSLTVSSSMMLDLLFSIEGIALPGCLCLENCDEPSVTFEWPVDYTSLKFLYFWDSKIKSLPTSLKSLSRLVWIAFLSCPNISSLPDLPDSVQSIQIWGCKLLEESCRAPNGENWPKIAHIPYKYIR